MKDVLSTFQGFRICFVRRGGNKAAHVYARTALSLVSSVCSNDAIPGFLIEPVQSDTLSSME